MPPEKSRYLTGSIGSTMLGTAISMLPGTIAISGYNIADTYFVSKLGTEPLAAMGFTFPMVMLIGCLFRGVSVGIMTSMAHALGAGKRVRTARIVSSGLVLTALFSLLLGVVGAITMQPTFRLLGASEVIMPLIIQYMIVWYLGSVTGAIGHVANDVLIAAGSTMTASLMMLGGLGLNVVLDPLFIFGWGGVFPAMGMTGAALATVIAQFMSGAISLIIIRNRLHLLASFRVPLTQMLGVWKLITAYAIPSSVGMLLLPVGNAVVTWVVAGFGTAAVAATAAAGRLEVLAFMFPMALGMSLMPMAAQNYGAGYFDRINSCRRFAMRFALFYGLLMAVAYVIFAAPLTKFFSDDPEVLRIMKSYLAIVPFGFGMIEIHRYGGFFLTACGHPTAAAWLNALRIVGLLVPLSLLARWAGSLDMVFYMRLTSDVAAGTVAWWAASYITRRLLKGNPVGGALQG